MVVSQFEEEAQHDASNSQNQLHSLQDRGGATALAAVVALAPFALHAVPAFAQEPERCPFVVRMTLGLHPPPNGNLELSLKDSEGNHVELLTLQRGLLEGPDRLYNGLGPSDKPKYGGIWITHTEGTISPNRTRHTRTLDGHSNKATLNGVSTSHRDSQLLVTHGLYQPETPVEPALRPEPQNPSERIPQMPAWKTGGYDWRSHFETGWGYPVPHRTAGHNEDFVAEAGNWRVSLATHYLNMPNSPWNNGNSKPIPSNESHDKSVWPPGMENLVKRIDDFWVYVSEYNADKAAWDAEKLQYDTDYAVWERYQETVSLLESSKAYYLQLADERGRGVMESGNKERGNPNEASGRDRPTSHADHLGWWRDSTTSPATVTVAFDHPRCADAVIPIDQALALETNPVTLAAFDREGYRPDYISLPPEVPAMETTPGSIEEQLELILELLRELHRKLDLLSDAIPDS